MQSVSILILSALFTCSACYGDSIFLDFENPESGSSLGVEPLESAAGLIFFEGEFGQVPKTDQDFVDAGAFGNMLDIDNDTSTAVLVFDFDVSSLTFIYGGGPGLFDVSAFDIDGNVVDSFFQPSTDVGEDAGPLTLEGIGIRQLAWTDPGFNFAAIDNLTITVVPEPSMCCVAIVLLVPFLSRRQRRVA